MPKNNYDDDDDDDLLMALQSMEPCGNCGAEGAKIPCMSGCGEVFYCSRECNMHHASAHRLRCRNLRCSKFNDSESESDSDDSDEYETDSSAEYETDSDEEDEEEEEVKPKKKKKAKKKGRSKSRRVNSSRSVESSGSTLSRKVSVSLDADVEKRIEEKILRRLKKQEEARISQAIEARMREEKANWRDDEMNRIIMEMRERFQSEMSTTSFWTALAKKNGLEMDSQEMVALQKSMEHSFLASNPQSEDKMAVPLSAEEAVAAGVSAIDGTPEATVSRTRSVSKESSWNNACAAFDALRVVVWKHSFLPRLHFRAEDTTDIWNTVTELDADESFTHISAGDKLLSVNGRAIDESVCTEDDLNDIFAAYASPIIMKFEAADPSPENCKVHDYTVTWSNGPLGVTLKDDCATQKIPIVNRLTKKAGSVAVKQNIAIGDVLVAINNIDTIQLGCSLSMSILKKVQLPAKLRFRGVGGSAPEAASNNNSAPEVPPRSSVTVSRAASLKPENISVDERAPSVMNFSMSMSRPSKYTINWGEGPLGLTIIPGLDEGDLPVIKKVTGTGTSVGIDKAQVGDFLESMNGIEAATMHFEDVVSYLKTAPKPVLLRFRAALDEDDARGPSSYRSNGTALSVKSDSSSHSSYSTPVRATPPTPAPMPAPSKHTTEVVRQVSREAPSDLYKVVWGSGPLGLTIDAKDGDAPGAFIKRIAAQGAAAHLSQDCLGDDVTHINDMDVSHVVFQDIVAHLKSVPRPVTLFFRRKSAQPHHERHGSYSSNSSGNSPIQYDTPAPSHSRKAALAAAGEDNGVQFYNVVWQDGTPLGLSLRGADNTCEYPYITRVTGTGSAAHLPQSVMNDCLISVDGRSVHIRDKSFEEVMTLLKVMQKPLTLKFQVRNVGGAPVPAPAPTPAPAPQYQHRAPSPSPPPPQQQQPQQRKVVKTQESYTWRQNRAPPPPPPQQPLAQSYNQSSSSPMMHQNSNNLSRSVVSSGSDRGLGAGVTSGNADKFSSIQAPFLVQNKLSTGRRQKMLKGLKK
ncbi:hypothetical protein PF005_g15170 [Phytophthora fragariae]|uniref:PDZ domain-containing protein n=1 Tax=Phytophthora fragariae TaxID=53985 RepID=A0A6A3TMA1_9STRA|nr:hypothetical protein PF003_g9648 [Phytophthora fragariae]KAE8933445.1 hypothetical protein PF009_g16551 [Phytophthora fragariae]KAE9100195.1 hypothetical protein PF007_g15609 [Phytophthora fragariae]KAE9100956.1 hypothetical protein PF010_g14617 [Phytophthora fragariae]KAE9136948.1 hypothetical protein PF006_g14281 [Phytophthora fragariae]